MRLADVQLQLPSFRGQVRVQTAGLTSAPLVIALRGSGPSGPCWEDAAAFLSDHGFRVALPDLHSNDSTLPAALTAGDAVKLVIEVADALQAQQFRIMGHHWGSIVAFNTARAWPQRIQRLVLTAPPISDGGIIRSLPGVFPVLLLWTARDNVVPLRLAQTFITELGPRLTLNVSLADASVAISPEWFQPIWQFLSP